MSKDTKVVQDAQEMMDEYNSLPLTRKLQFCQHPRWHTHVEELLKVVAELEARLRWIPVSEQVPDNDRLVDVTNGDWVSEDYYWKERWERRGVTHWAEKRQPPTGEQE